MENMNVIAQDIAETAIVETVTSPTTDTAEKTEKIESTENLAPAPEYNITAKTTLGDVLAMPIVNFMLDKRGINVDKINFTAIILEKIT